MKIEMQQISIYFGQLSFERALNKFITANYFKDGSSEHCSIDIFVQKMRKSAKNIRSFTSNIQMHRIRNIKPYRFG